MSGRRIAGPLAVALIGALAAAVSPPPARDIVVRVVIVIVGSWTTWALLRRLRAATASPPERFDALRVPTRFVPTELPGLGAVEAALRMSMTHALGVEILLGRLLRDIARWRLHRNRAIDLEMDPGRAQRASGDALWRLIGPEAHASTGTTRVARSALDAAIDRLEQI